MKETFGNTGMGFEDPYTEKDAVLGQGGVETFGSQVVAEADLIPDLGQDQKVMETRLNREQARATQVKIGNFLLGKVA